MSKFSFIAILIAIVIVVGCKKTVNLKPVDIKWDREVCTRCVMQVNDRLHSAQIVDPKTGKHYFFDDLGCASLWLVEQNQDWKADAVIYITDGVDGKWINKNEAVFAQGFKTPMSFGVAAFRNSAEVPDGKTVLTYDETTKIFQDIKYGRMMKRAAAKVVAEEQATDNSSMGTSSNSEKSDGANKKSGMEKTK